MTYFKNTKFVPYRFGNDVILHQNLTAYSDIVDQIKGNIAFYQKYTILENDRPDNVSFKLYKTTKHHWSFFLLNDNLREFGWPMSNGQFNEFVEKKYGNTILVTRSSLSNRFMPGSNVVGNTSSSTGVIDEKNELLGQIKLKCKSIFSPSELVLTEENSEIRTIQILNSIPQYQSVHHYENSDGEWVDINPYLPIPSEVVPVTYYDYFFRLNSERKDILVIKPNVIDSIYEEFQRSMAE